MKHSDTSDIKVLKRTPIVDSPQNHHLGFCCDFRSKSAQICWLVDLCQNAIVFARFCVVCRPLFIVTIKEQSIEEVFENCIRVGILTKIIEQQISCESKFSTTIVAYIRLVHIYLKAYSH